MLSVLAKLDSMDLGVLYLEGKPLPLGDTAIVPLHVQLWLLSNHFRVLVVRDKKRKGIIILGMWHSGDSAGVIYCDHQDEAGC